VQARYPLLLNETGFVTLTDSGGGFVGKVKWYLYLKSTDKE
jgi:hypothetical protein